MSRRFSKYPYDNEPAVARAFLYNLRDNDLRAGGSISEGEILSGQCGFAVAEADVPGFAGNVAAYRPNRCVEWEGHFLTCMALDALPAGAALRKMGSSLRHRHYVVAELPVTALVKHARKIGLPVISAADGCSLANLEIFPLPGRTPSYRIAKLL